VAKPELGTKRLCPGCGAKYYDLSKDPIVCPKCDTVFVAAPVVSRSRPDAAPRPAAAAPAEEAVPETQGAEFVSLEEADAEAQGAKKPGEAAEGEEEDVEIETAIDDDDSTFIEEQEEEDADVTDIIGGDIENEEET
jgi:uncharacterized protein (TIGR02300 family)